MSNAAFVEQLYETVLNRSGEAAGIASWVQALAGGDTRAHVTAAFALSSEYVSDLQSAFLVGVFLPDQNAADAARLYFGILGRTHDATGLALWQSALKSGESLHDVAQSFLASAEFQAKGNLTDAAFVDSLYMGALGRHAQASGSQSWVLALPHGTSRGNVAVSIAQSDEAHQHLVAVIETGWHLV